MAEPLRITRIETLDALAPLRERWNALAAQSAAGSVFQTWEWAVSWLRAWGDTCELWALLAEEGDQLVGVAPLILRRRRVLGRTRRVIEFLGADLFRICDFIVARDRPDVAAALFDWLDQRRSAWDTLLLANLHQDSPTVSWLTERAAARGRRYTVRELDCEPTRLMGDAEADYATTNSRKTRQHLNRFYREGQAEWAIHADAEALLRDLESFARFHIARWASTDTPSDFNHPAFREFHRQLALNFAPTGWFKMGSLTLDGEPVALNMFFEYHNAIYLFECCYDPARAALSPGFLSHVLMVRYGIAQGVARVNFGRGHEPYKFGFCNWNPVHHELRLWARRGAYEVDRLLMRALDALSRRPAWANALRRLSSRRQG